MISGIGTDLVEVERIARSISDEKGFREMIFSKAEIAYCESCKNKFEHYAARFAAKEAFFKALGTGWTTGTLFNEVETTHTVSGQPEIKLLGNTAKTITQTGKIFVSLSHTKTMASAIVIIEK